MITKRTKTVLVSEPLGQKLSIDLTHAAPVDGVRVSQCFSLLHKFMPVKLPLLGSPSLCSVPALLHLASTKRNSQSIVKLAKWQALQRILGISVVENNGGSHQAGLLKDIVP